MKCAWQAYKNLLPIWLQKTVDKQEQKFFEEIRLRINAPAEIILSNKTLWTDKNISGDDIQYVINVATQYSPWSAQSVSNGYITTQGGHRIGLCGEAVFFNDTIKSFRKINALCIRCAKDFMGVAEKAKDLQGSVLIIGEPGSGKTTFLRDLIRQRSDYQEKCVCVVDERCEVFPLICGTSCFYLGKRTDVLSACKKPYGVKTLLRNMRPHTIALDEITDEDDCNAMINAAWCGVQMFATAHAGCKADLLSRPIYKYLLASRIFQNLITIKPDKTWSCERLYAG